MDAGEVLERYGAKVRRHLQRFREFSEADRDDLYQEVAVLVVRNLGQFRGAANVSTWLHRVTRNVALMRLRSRGHQAFSRAVPLESVCDDPPEVEVERDLARARLLRATLELAGDEGRQLLEWFYVDGLLVHEIATLVHCDSATVRTRLYRLRVRLRGLVPEEDVDAADLGARD